MKQYFAPRVIKSNSIQSVFLCVVRFLHPKTYISYKNNEYRLNNPWFGLKFAGGGIFVSLHRPNDTLDVRHWDEDATHTSFGSTARPLVGRCFCFVATLFAARAIQPNERIIHGRGNPLLTKPQSCLLPLFDRIKSRRPFTRFHIFSYICFIKNSFCLWENKNHFSKSTFVLLRTKSASTNI